MEKDTVESSDRTRDPAAPDPLGLGALGVAVRRLARLGREDAGAGRRPARWSVLADDIERRFEDAAERYEMLRDRYALLKRLNAQLADELEWLRDQVDDLAAQTASPATPSARTESSPPEPRRRFDDRRPR